jgi:hypothetical protein
MPKVDVEKMIQKGFDFRQLVAKEMTRGLPACLKFCVDVIEGKEKDVHITSQGKEIKKPVSIRDRLDAVKKFKELAIDKVLPDMKQTEIKTEVVSTKDVLEFLRK